MASLGSDFGSLAIQFELMLTADAHRDSNCDGAKHREGQGSLAAPSHLAGKWADSQWASLVAELRQGLGWPSKVHAARCGKMRSDQVQRGTIKVRKWAGGGSNGGRLPPASSYGSIFRGSIYPGDPSVMPGSGSIGAC